MKVVLDSTVLFSIFYQKDEWHDTGMRIFSDFMKKKIEAIIPTLAIPEVCGAMRRETGDHRVPMIIESQLYSWIDAGIISLKELTIGRTKSATESAIRYSLKGADSVFVGLTEELKGELATFDQGVIDKVKGKVKLFKME